MRLNRLLCIIAMIFSAFSVVISLIAFWSSCNYEYNSENAIMSAFSIIVSVLIGAVTIVLAWQVYNHYVAKDEVKKMIEDEVPRIAMDIWHVLDSKDIADSDICLLATADVKDYQKIDKYIKSLEYANKCKIESLKTYSINYVLNRFHSFFMKQKENEERHIMKGCKERYLYICKNISHQYIDELKNYINTAKEIAQQT